MVFQLLARVRDAGRRARPRNATRIPSFTLHYLTSPRLCAPAHSTTTMHSTLTRLQNVFGFFTTVAFFVATFVALTSLLVPQTPTSKLTLRNVQVYAIAQLLRQRTPTNMTALV